VLFGEASDGNDGEVLSGEASDGNDGEVLFGEASDGNDGEVLFGEASDGNDGEVLFGEVSGLILGGKAAEEQSGCGPLDHHERVCAASGAVQTCDM
jgi:hypothetical protein